MATRTLTIAYEELSPAELSEDEQTLCASAKRAVDLAYAPYSRFRVGAAALLADGRVIQAANLENAAYPQCLCAEATLLGALHTQYAGERIVAVAVTACDVAGTWVQAAPCGSCRQQLYEAQRRQATAIIILLVGASGGAVKFSSVESLLPLGFALAND